MQQEILFEDLGRRRYKEIWDYQEALLKKNTDIKYRYRIAEPALSTVTELPTTHHLLFVEHDPVYTLGKSGKADHVLIGEAERNEKGIMVQDLVQIAISPGETNSETNTREVRA